MNKSNKFRRALRAVAATIAAGALTVTGCTDVDDTLGSNLVPDNEQMKAGFVTLDGRLGGLNPKKIVETRLFQTDSIIGSNISYGYLGAMVSDTFGMRSAAFLSQYVSYYRVDSGYFGYLPIFDSAQMLLSISSYGSDTTTDQTFGVYEILSNDYITEKPVGTGKTRQDTIFYVNFDPETVSGLVGDLLFTFTLGQSNNTGPATKAVTMSPTPEGRKFVKRLMLQDGEYKGDYSIYSTDSLKYWVEAFKGLYVKPMQQPIGTEAGKVKGTVYGTSLSASGFAVYGRNRMKENPALIKDTIGMVYYFYDSEAKYGNVSVNSIRHDYTNAKFDIMDAVETKTDRPENTTIYVAGMGGVISELTFSKEFFDELNALLAKENETGRQDFTTLAFSQAKMSIYFWGSAYDWENLPDIPHLVGQMNASQNRLGLYTDYKKLTPIADYAYVYEKSYSTELPYGGYINRSRGCYVMDITGYMQGLWNSYIKEYAAAKAENRAVDLSKVEHRSIYLGPEAYGLFTDAYSVTQGEAGGDNNASIRLDLTYNMIK